jgi:hypothetical protein
MNDAAHPHPSDRAAICLDRALAQLEQRTASPLRLVSQASTDVHETFEFREEDERGGRKQRFLVSVADESRDLLVVVLPTDSGYAA